ncbi:hypothetical protein LSH36_206g04024 [Paralvinella palmiformis]|uniref:Proteasomal ubiquitin receptor ADRM1 n=1 Tax=Paralvinella palmiformis TaxID=53620 RepID=A0AAD9JPW2_9ANNE|nr:hypothetical protein LSH36_206g04024 [Paralvinella palmiformis]
MASGALFGGQAGRSHSKNLVEFRAGKMYMKGRMVHPDKRKGQIYVYQSDDSLMHFCWKDRSKNTPEDDLIIFPEDVEFKHVPQCTTGRVYILKFKASTRKMFFWMQEPKSDKDEEFSNKVNENLNNPPAPGASRSTGGTGTGSGLGELAAGLGGGSDLQNLLSNMSQQELMQLLSGMGVGGLGGGLSALMGGRPSSSQSDIAPPVTAAVLPSQDADGTAATPTSTGSGSKSESKESSAIQLSDLQNILSGLGAKQEGSKETIDLSKAVTPEAMIPILANSEVQERLLPFLPEGENLPRTEAELRSTVSSPQFLQAMNSFSAALASGQLGPLMNQFNLGEDVVNAASQGDVEAFAKALQANLDKSKSEDEEMKDDEKKED